ncbi:MAG TPA: lipoprotein [Bauldia sp.]|nr:lipoprotein [Bauldia sp.]
MVRAAAAGGCRLHFGGAAVARVERRFLSTLIVLALVAVAASACGRKGPLDPPAAALTPSDATTATAPADDGTTKKPNKPFVLDPLIK